jgi:pantetheine-phosphate adenylyltransferase
LNILQKAEKIFDKVIILNGINPEKNPEYDATKSHEYIHPLNKTENLIINREAWYFSGMLIDEIKYHSQYANVSVLRGLRSGKDLDYEVNQLRFLEQMYPDIKEVFIMSDKEYEHISSSAIRNISKISKKEASKYLI